MAEHRFTPGHTYNTGSRHPKAKLTEEKVRAIRKMREDGILFKVIAYKFNVACNTVESVCRRVTWKHVI